MSGLVLPKHVIASRNRQKQEMAAAEAIKNTSKHRYDSDDWATSDDVANQLIELKTYVTSRREEEPGYILPQPMGWRLMVLMLTVPEKSAGGVIIIDDAKEARSLATPQGVVLAMGPQSYQDPDRFKDPWCEIGDRITMTKYDAQTFQLANGQRLGFINDTQPLSVIDKGWEFDA